MTKHTCVPRDVEWIDSGNGWGWNNSCVLSCSRKEFWDILLTDEFWKECFSIKSVKYTTEKGQTGTMREIVTLLFTAEETFINWKEPEAFEFYFSKSSVASIESFAESFTIAEAKDGKCTFTAKGRISGRGVGGFFVVPVYGVLIRRAQKSFLTKVNTFVEGKLKKS